MSQAVNDNAEADATPTFSRTIDLGGFLGENVFCSLTSDWTPQHNDPGYSQLGSIADTAVVSGLHTASQLTDSLRRAGLFDDTAGHERLVDLRLSRLRWIAPVLVGARPEWTVRVENKEANGPLTTVSTRHTVQSGDLVHMVAEHTGIVAATDALPLGPSVIGHERSPIYRDRGAALATDPDRLYDDQAYLSYLASLPDARYVGVTPWVTVSQREADVFAEVSGGRVPWHNDPAFCAQAALLGRPVVHPMHLVAFCSYASQVVGLIRGSNVAWSSPRERSRDRQGTAMAYGLDDVVWSESIPVGTPFRIHVTLESLVPRGPGRFVGSFLEEFEVEGSPFAVLSMVWKTMLFSETP